ncbi:cell wall protein Pga30p [[Candida] railenensis]|uniref:Cell wall protein Pga30p n=1 Tax=[Candida] railenensis TaxID=45579 RepID=A0A9P0QRA5_9ASCO|nr:cell wall protein Pga30p [[Candida] railenensis]
MKKMRLSSVVLSITAVKAVLATTYSVELYVDSTDDSIAGKALSSIHEGAGINYFLLGTSPEVLTYDDSTQFLGGEVGYVSTYDDFLLEGVLGAGNITFDGEHLVVNDIKDFYAAKNVNDPYQYSTQSYIVLSSNSDATDSIKFNIKVSGLPSSLASSSLAASEAVSDTSSTLVSSVSASSSTIEATELLTASRSSVESSSTESVEEQSTTDSTSVSESGISRFATSSASGLVKSSSIINSTITTAILTSSARNSTSVRTSQTSSLTSITTDSTHSTHSSSSATGTGSSSSKGAANKLNSLGAGLIAVACYLL